MCPLFIQLSDLQSIILKDFLSYWTPSKHFPSLATEICTLVFQETYNKPQMIFVLKKTTNLISWAIQSNNSCKAITESA